ncbi:MAG: antibiotic biosynthesis monooxygenase [Thalassovita sp.]
MYVVTVTFKIHPGQMDQFLPLMVENARTSRKDEAGCQLFDVCRDGDEVFLYEVYDDRAAFDLHLESAHFKAFSAKVDTLVAGKELRLYQEVIR